MRSNRAPNPVSGSGFDLISGIFNPILKVESEKNDLLKFKVEILILTKGQVQIYMSLAFKDGIGYIYI